MASPDELWLVDVGDPFPGEPAQQRPALVVGPPDTFGADFHFCWSAPLTTTRRGLSLHVEVEPSGTTGVDRTSYVQCELVRSVSLRRLVHRMGAIDSDTSARVTDVLRTLLTQ